MEYKYKCYFNRNMFHMMLFILFGWIAGYANSPDPLLLFLEQLEVDRSFVYMDGVALQELGDDSGMIAAVIPVLSERTNDYFILDAYVLLSDRESGNIKAVFFEEGAWTSDAYVLNDIEIEPEPYPIAPDASAIGVVLYYQSSSRVNRVGSRELSLFVERNGDLTRVLKDYHVMGSDVVFDGECDSSSSFRSRNIEVSEQQTNGFYDLNVKEEEERRQLRPENCSDPDVTVKEREYDLKFSGGRYQQVEQ